MITEGYVSADTQAALLLAAPLQKRSQGGPSPLSAAEYNELATAFQTEGLRPSDLLQLKAAAVIPALLRHLPSKMRENVTSDRVTRLLERGGQLALALTHWTSAGIWVISRADKGYPSRLKRKYGRSSPPIIYAVGPESLLDRGGLAVVGSREPDEFSDRYTMRVGEWAASASVQIVSGAARGVDERSMLACVDAGGTAVGVVGESLLKLSTRRNFREAILAERLALISSFDPDAGFTVGNAMGRNRWIYALADRALIVACREGSGGTWAGAIEALKRGTTVYVKTGNPMRPGNDALLTHGALSAPDDLTDLWSDKRPALSATEATTTAAAIPQFGPTSDDAYEILLPTLVRVLHEPMTAKQLVARTGLMKSQADVWLKRLVAEGRAKKIRSTYRALDVRHGQPRLL